MIKRNIEMTMTARNIHSVKLFYSYAHEDRNLRDELAKHMGRTRISGWYDREIVPGTNWEDEIDENLESVDIVLLLISPDFKASEYCDGKEMKWVLEREREKEVYVIPILMRPVYWPDAPFRHLQMSPTPYKPVTTWINRDEAFVAITTDVHRTIDRVLTKQYIQDAKTYITAGQYEEAYITYKQAMSYNPVDPIPHIETGDLLITFGRYEEALKEYEIAITLRPENDSFYTKKGEVLSQLKLHESALAAYQQSVRLKKNDFTLYKALGDTLYILKRLNEAVEAYREAIRLAPENVEIYIAEGNALHSLKDFLSALSCYETAIFIEPENAQYYIYKGDVLRDLKRFTEALACYEEAIHLESGNLMAYLSSCDVLFSLGRFTDAQLLYDKVDRLHPDNAQIYLHKGGVLRKINHLEDALASYDQAIHLDTGNADAYYGKSMILKDLKRYEEALISYEQALRIDPGIESTDITESPQSLLARIEAVQRFLMRAGFDVSTMINHVGFLAIQKRGIWNKRFPNGLYVRILFDIPLDQRMVQSIYNDAKERSSHALVVINKQPEISGWMAIGGLRAAEKDHFILLPIAESLIKEGSALSKEVQTLGTYISKNLGKDFDPYDLRDPVSDAVNFFGRESLMDEIANALKSGHRLGLFGLHKMGKSSLLQRLQKKLEFPVAYVYLRTGDRLSDIYRRIMEGWAIDIRIKYPELQWSMPHLTETSDIKTIFDTSAKELLVKLRGAVDPPLLAIFLDETDHIVPYKQGDEHALHLYTDLMDSLRGLQQETNSLSLLVADVHPNLTRRNYFWGNQKNPMYQVISERFLLPLGKDDCSYMIRSLGQQVNINYEEEVLEYIIRMSGAHPFLARQLCSFAYKDRGDLDTITMEVIQRAVQNFVKDPATTSYFDDYGLWGELGKQDMWGKDVSYANHRILKLLAASLEGVSQSDIYMDLEKEIAELSFNALKERGVISALSHLERYQITFGVFHEWIRLHKLDGIITPQRHGLYGWAMNIKKKMGFLCKSKSIYSE